MPKKILFLCKKVPYPASDGESIVILSDIRVLRSLGFHVSIYCLNTQKHKIDTTYYDNISIWNEFISSPIKTNSLKTILKSLISIFPFQIARFYNSKIDRDILQYIKNEEIDTILFQGLAMTQYLKETHVQKIYRVHNLEYKVWSELSFNTNNWTRKVLYSIVSESLRKYEEVSLGNMSRFATLSREECTEINNFYPNKSAVLPIYIHRNYKTRYNPDNEGILFIGSLDWKPNQEGLNWFLNNIYPQLNEIPITIAGKGHYKSPHRFKNLNIIPNFKDIEDLFSNHRLVIVPLLSGAGIRIKIIESLQYGIPVISTKIGAMGIKSQENAITISDSIHEWVYKISEIYHSKARLKLQSILCISSYKQYYAEDPIQEDWSHLIS